MKNCFLTILTTICSIINTNAQGVISATLGTGKYKNDIKWLNFNDLAEIKPGPGVRLTKNFFIGDVEVTVVIKDLSFAGKLAYDGKIEDQRLIKYSSGTWDYDGLVKLYNIGVPNTSTASRRKNNILFNALRNKFDGDYDLGMNSTFTIEAYAKLNGQPMDLGLVYANAEEDSPSEKYTEYTEGTTNGSAWQLLEKFVDDRDGKQEIKLSNNNRTARTSCGWGNVAIMYTKKAATSSASPMQVNINMLSGGNSAVALGVLIGYDLGDAPVSYGTPANVSFYDINEGNPVNPNLQSTFTNYLGELGNGGGKPVILEGKPSEPVKSRIGTNGGDTDPAESSALHNATADVDDKSGTDDEDGISFVPTLNVNDNSYSIQFSATSTNFSQAFVSAWIDLNRDGVFSATEYKSTIIPVNSTRNINLIWDNLGPQILKSGISYLRLRISLYDSKDDDKMETLVDERSVMALSGGETEDYKLEITSTIRGNVFLDANGLLGSPTNTIDGKLISTAADQQLIVGLLNTSNVIIQTKKVESGAFSFTGPFDGLYQLYLIAENNTGLPLNWVYTGETQTINAESVGSDGEVNGITKINITGKDTYAKFGIQQRPAANDQYLQISNNKLKINTIYSLPSIEPTVNVPQLSGSDPEESPSFAIDSISNGGTFVITALPSSTDATLYYNSEPVKVGSVISNYDPTLLQIAFLKKDLVSLNFGYSVVDEAGFQPLKPATYRIDLLTILPASGFKLFAQQNNEKTLLQWQTLMESNTDYFEIQQSLDGKNYISIGRTEAARTSNTSVNYSFTAVSPNIASAYYRIILHDQNGNLTISNVVQISNIFTLKLLPNPAKSYTVLSGLSGSNSIELIGSDGKILQNVTTSNQTQTINVNHLPIGVYWIKITQQQKIIKLFKLVKE
jgi:hypothetical protein